MTLIKDMLVAPQQKTMPAFFEILKSNKDLGFIINLETFKFEYVSELSTELFGFAPEQIERLGIHKFFELIHPLDIEKINEEVENSEDCHTLEEIRYRFKYGGLKYKWLTEKRQILYSQLNTPTFMISSYREV